MQPFHLHLEDILAKYDWISTVTHPPNIASLLRTNDAPSPLQSTQLKASLEGLKGPLADLESDLELLRNAVMLLETRMSRLQSLKHDYETALSPIRRIPLEITMEIVRRSWGDDFAFPVFRIRDGPWHLGQVCSLWRNVVEKYCPELWATIEVSLLCYRGAVPIKADMAETLRVVLERSRNHPLNVQFGFVGLDDVEGRGVAGMERCFDIMIAHSKRWRVVDMMIPPYLLSRLSLIRGRIDWLENIRLSSYGDPQSGDIRAFEVAPKLKKLHLNDMHPEASIRFPVANLVSFFDKRAFGGDKLTREYLDVVRLAPNLRSFSYNDYGISHISMPLSFPCVTSRSLTELSASSPKFLRNMELPSLREFTLTTMCNADTGGVVIKCPEDALGALHEMLLRSQCSLTKLHLIDAVLDNNLANIIRLVPSLQEFDIDFYEWMDDYDPIMQSLVTQMSEVRLVDGSPQHSMVPSLQGLCVNLFDVSNRHISFINSAFVDMVASRLHQPTDTPRLRWLDLRALGHRQSYDIDESGENILESLMDDGLELYLSLHDNDRRFG